VGFGGTRSGSRRAGSRRFEVVRSADIASLEEGERQRGVVARASTEGQDHAGLRHDLVVLRESERTAVERACGRVTDLVAMHFRLDHVQLEGPAQLEVLVLFVLLEGSSLLGMIARR
jgi:hypothetical protein